MILFERCNRSFHFFSGRYFLFPPWDMFHAILFINRASTAHAEDSLSINREHLPSVQMIDIRSDFTHLPAKFVNQRELVEHIKVLMVAINPKCREVFRCQPVLPPHLSMRTVPAESKIATYDYEIILRQFLLLWELCCIKLGNINVCVCISSDINHAQFLSHLQSICIVCSGLFVYLL